MEKKRKNEEIVAFISEYKPQISSKLQRIEIVKLSSEHLKETKDKIDDMKREIKRIQKEISNQEKIYNKTLKEESKIKINTTRMQNSLFSSNESNGIEIFQIEEEEIDEKVEEEEEL